MPDVYLKDKNLCFQLDQHILGLTKLEGVEMRSHGYGWDGMEFNDAMVM